LQTKAKIDGAGSSVGLFFNFAAFYAGPELSTDAVRTRIRSSLGPVTATQVSALRVQCCVSFDTFCGQRMTRGNGREACRYFKEHLAEVPGKQLDSVVDFRPESWSSNGAQRFFISGGAQQGETGPADLSLHTCFQFVQDD
jgi:hypothetical protein